MGLGNLLVPSSLGRVLAVTPGGLWGSHRERRAPACWPPSIHCQANGSLVFNDSEAVYVQEGLACLHVGSICLSSGDGVLLRTLWVLAVEEELLFPKASNTEASISLTCGGLVRSNALCRVPAKLGLLGLRAQPSQHLGTKAGWWQKSRPCTRTKRRDSGGQSDLLKYEQVMMLALIQIVKPLLAELKIQKSTRQNVKITHNFNYFYFFLPTILWEWESICKQKQRWIPSYSPDFKTEKNHLLSCSPKIINIYISVCFLYPYVFWHCTNKYVNI